MRKRARNHKLKVEREQLYKNTSRRLNYHFEYIFEMITYKFYEGYEPQGKREAKKYTKGLLYYIHGTFNGQLNGRVDAEGQEY